MCGRENEVGEDIVLRGKDLLGKDRKYDQFPPVA